MQSDRTCRSDRVSLEVPIQVAGTDATGRDFTADTRTLVLSRHGAKIVLGRKLVPDQEVSIFCKSTGKESVARVVGQMGKIPEGYLYGVELLDPEVNLWDIEFPPLSESEKAAARVLLECGHCHSRVLSYLNEFEAEVFEANGFLSRACKRCKDVTVWKLCLAQGASEQIPLPVSGEASPELLPTPPARTANERRDLRISLKINACLRDRQGGEDIVVTENVSRAGFSFKSPKSYAVGSIIEVAVPYARDAGNIFTPARVEHAESLPGEQLTVYGVSYIRIHQGWPGT